jgi:DNA polymerase
MSGLDAARRNRIRLWLRGERAFGITSVRAVELGQDVQSNEVFPAAEQAAPPRRPAVLPVEAPMPKRAIVNVAPPKAPAPAPRLAAPPAGVPFDAPTLSADEKVVRLNVMDAQEVSVCTKCRLHSTRTNTVFGEGSPEARIFFIGEGPGENEDLSGRPFVGRAGQLLDRMIGGMGLRREDVFIANIVKCRPPGNRVPAPDEVATCTPYLVRQLEIVRPQVIVTLGRPATNYMLGTNLAMGKLRGEWQSWRGIRLMPTFHPSYVLRSYTEEVRAAVWSDLKKVLVELGLPVPSRRGA